MEPARSRAFYLGRYNCMERIGLDPLGETFRAKIYGVAGFEKQFAVKRLHEALCQDEEFVSRFVNASTAYAGLDHERIARVHEVNVQGQQYYIAVDLVRGADVARLLELLGARGETLPADVAVLIALDVADALEHAHARKDLLPTGVLHLGLEPHSIVITSEGEVRVSDVGLMAARVRLGWADDDALLPTLAYLPPEELRADPLDARADVFALGAVLYELLSGQRAFPGEEARTVRQRIEAGPQPLPAHASAHATIDPRLQALIAQALQPDPQARLGSMAAFREQLLPILGSRSNRARAELGQLVRRLVRPERKTGAFPVVAMPATTAPVTASPEANTGKWAPPRGPLQPPPGAPPSTIGDITAISAPPGAPPPSTIGDITAVSPPPAAAAPEPEPDAGSDEILRPPPLQPRGPQLAVSRNTLAGIGADDQLLVPIEAPEFPGAVTTPEMAAVPVTEDAETRPVAKVDLEAQTVPVPRAPRADLTPTAPIPRADDSGPIRQRTRTIPPPIPVDARPPPTAADTNAAFGEACEAASKVGPLPRPPGENSKVAPLPRSESSRAAPLPRASSESSQSAPLPRSEHSRAAPLPPPWAHAAPEPAPSEPAPKLPPSGPNVTLEAAPAFAPPSVVAPLPTPPATPLLSPARPPERGGWRVLVPVVFGVVVIVGGLGFAFWPSKPAARPVAVPARPEPAKAAGAEPAPEVVAKAAPVAESAEPAPEVVAKAAAVPEPAPEVPAKAAAVPEPAPEAPAKAAAVPEPAPEVPAKAAVAEPAPVVPAKPAAPPAEAGPGNLEVSSEPAGAHLFLDGEERGVTPLALSVPEGAHALVVLGEGSQVRHESVRVTGPHTRLELKLEPARLPAEIEGEAGLKVRCKTTGELRILVDGHDTGMACPNEKRISLKPGAHKIGLYSPRTGKTVEVDKELEADPDHSARLYVKY